MSHATLVLPFGLPLPEVAGDLAKVMQTPSLALLLARARRSALPFDDSQRLLPHEQWLAARCALLPAGPGQRFLVHPTHVQVTRKHLVMADWRQLDLDDEEARALHAAAAPLCEELGITLSYGNASTWQMRADQWTGIDTASPDIATGENLSDYTPTGANALALRKLQNEIQMLWFQHPVNTARELRGQAPVNGCWIWAPPAPSQPAVVHASPAPYGLDLPAAPAPGQGGSIYLDSLSGPALRGDWGSWLAEIDRLEQTWFAPLLAALRSGSLRQLRLILSDRQRLAAFDLRPTSLYQFWHRPSLQALSQ
ncbi:hypothetical protein [Massilia sp. TS11]|uniref:hypothetical protein n=1 Tax=Massilia sp. TS11 TaxID=2908003 RepID=UPI001EDC12C1|nr:hypothetical protein [Massilia sp. TS11]MCG2584596.1 hypothetical protein [Massilia sp. TS11]